MEMKHRIERQIEQRTTMLAGVSHDLRTILTRFKLELALIEDSPEAEALRRDVEEMQRCSRPISRSRAAKSARSRARRRFGNSR